MFILSMVPLYFAPPCSYDESKNMQVQTCVGTNFKNNWSMPH